MKFGEPFAVPVDNVNFCNHNNSEGENNEYNFCRTNVWNNSFQSPEMSCDFAVLHSDLQEIKELIGEIRSCLVQFFKEE